jgi:uncharacterized protein (TIGR02246 family)
VTNWPGESYATSFLKEAPLAQSRRPVIAETAHDEEAHRAVHALVAELQAGWDCHDAEIADRCMSADIAWGSPYGATVHDFDTLYDIHQRLKRENTGGAQSRYEIDRVLPITADVVVAHVARRALNAQGEPILPGDDSESGFSEMALYVLVRRDGIWWLAAGQNTPIRPGGAI